MRIGLIMCDWILDSDGCYKPAVLVDYDILAYSDVTGGQDMIPDPNQVVVAVACSDAVANAIEADPDYTVLTDDGVTDGVLFTFSGADDSHWLNEVEEWLNG